MRKLSIRSLLLVGALSAGVVSLPFVLPIDAEAQTAAKTTKPAAKAADAPPPEGAIAVRTEQKTIDNWNVRCGYDKDEKKIGCSAVLNILEKDTSKVSAAWSVSKTAAAGYTTLVEVPVGVFIAPGVQIKIDGAALKPLPYVSCGRACIAAVQLDEASLKQVSAAKKVEITVTAIDRKSYTFAFDAKSIDKAISAIQ